MGEIKMEYDISVIIPVYNNKETLPETLDCILRQSVYNRAQIICVDDGSTDGSGEILRAYAKENPNITLISKENGGVSSARNAGLEKATGKYLVFLDADDLISPGDALGKLCAEMDKRDADAGIFRLMTFGFGGREYNPVTEELSQEETIDIFDKRILWNFPVSNKIYKTALIKENHLEFPPTVYTEDGAFWMRFIMTVRPRITGIAAATSMYRQSNPLIHTQATQNTGVKSPSDFIKSCGMILDSVTAAAEKSDLKKEEKEEYINEIYLRICHILINGFYRKILRADGEYISFISREYERYYALLTSANKKRLASPDLPEINFSKKYIAEHPLVSVKVKNPGEDFIRAMLCQTTPYFEICTDRKAEYDFISNSAPRAKTVIKLDGDSRPDPRLISGIVKLRAKFPFLPPFALKALATTYLKHRE